MSLFGQALLLFSTAESKNGTFRYAIIDTLRSHVYNNTGRNPSFNNKFFLLPKSDGHVRATVLKGGGTGEGRGRGGYVAMKRKPRVSLGGQAARYELARAIRPARSRRRINYTGILFTSSRKWNAQRQPGDAAAPNGVAKTGCTAKKSVSSALSLYRARMAAFNSFRCRFARPAFVVLAHSNEIAGERGAQFTYLVARTRGGCASGSAQGIATP